MRVIVYARQELDVRNASDRGGVIHFVPTLKSRISVLGNPVDELNIGRDTKPHQVGSDGYRSLELPIVNVTIGAKSAVQLDP